MRWQSSSTAWRVKHGESAELARLNWRKLGLFFASLLIFVLAIQLLREGARGLAPVIKNELGVHRPLNALGLGWLFAYLVLSGSPAAAVALTLFDAGALDRVGAFAMIAGSRLGASFIVLFIGFLYHLRGRERGRSLAMGLLSLTVTAAVNAPALVVGYLMLRAGWLDWAQVGVGPALSSLIDLAYGPAVRWAAALLPGWAVFGLGMGMTVGSFSLFDQALPDMRLQEGAFGGMARLLYRPIVTFLLGAAITSISLSVSLSLGILVPLSARGYIRRENVIPYIMGANITTFVDTLAVAVLLNNPAATTVVLAAMASVALVSFAVILFAFRPFERALLAAVRTVEASNRNLAIFILALVGLPVALIIWG